MRVPSPPLGHPRTADRRPRRRRAPASPKTTVGRLGLLSKREPTAVRHPGGGLAAPSEAWAMSARPARPRGGARGTRGPRSAARGPRRWRARWGRAYRREPGAERDAGGLAGDGRGGRDSAGPATARPSPRDADIGVRNVQGAAGGERLARTSFPRGAGADRRTDPLQRLPDGQRHPSCGIERARPARGLALGREHDPVQCRAGLHGCPARHRDRGAQPQQHRGSGRAAPPDEPALQARRADPDGCRRRPTPAWPEPARS